MSMNKDFTAPVPRYDDLSPETIQYHVARARVLRSQAFTAHVAAMVKLVTRLFARSPSRGESVPGSTGLAANQS